MQDPEGDPPSVVRIVGNRDGYTIYLTPSLSRELVEKAHRERRSMTSIIREAINA